MEVVDPPAKVAPEVVAGVDIDIEPDMADVAEDPVDEEPPALALMEVADDEPLVVLDPPTGFAGAVAAHAHTEEAATWTESACAIGVQAVSTQG